MKPYDPIIDGEHWKEGDPERREKERRVGTVDQRSFGFRLERRITYGWANRRGMYGMNSHQKSGMQTPEYISKLGGAVEKTADNGADSKFFSAVARGEIQEGAPVAREVPIVRMGYREIIVTAAADMSAAALDAGAVSESKLVPELRVQTRRLCGERRIVTSRGGNRSGNPRRKLPDGRRKTDPFERIDH